MYTSLGLFLISFILIIYVKIKDHKKNKITLTKKDKANYAILIPAKDESRVIENLLKSIPDNTNTYVIVEDINDKTCGITKKYNGNIIVRKNLTKKRKGFALDEAIKEILKTKQYDLYFIFDADNILDKNFIDEMIKTYKNGYQIGLGYRNIKNSTNTITDCSGLTFSMINNLINKSKKKFNKTMIISGTGYYISGELINKWKGFPFNSLTEDYELTLYSASNNISTFYNEKAIYYDEQPTKLSVSIIQRTRWIKGFFEARKKEIKNIKNDYSKIIGITPYLFMVIGFMILLISTFSKFIRCIINNSNYQIYLTIFIATIIIIYLVLLIFTIILIIKDKNLNIKNKAKTIFFNPIFLITYINALIKALTTNVTWEKIEHGK